MAAAAVVIGAGAFGGVKLAAGPAQVAGQDPHDAVGAPGGAWQTGYGSVGTVTGTVAYRSMGWGTQLAAKVAGLPLNTPCQLWIVEGNGTRVQAGSWDTDASEGAVWYPGSAQVAATAIKSFVITVSGRQSVSTRRPRPPDRQQEFRLIASGNTDRGSRAEDNVMTGLIAVVAVLAVASVLGLVLRRRQGTFKTTAQAPGRTAPSHRACHSRLARRPDRGRPRRPAREAGHPGPVLDRVLLELPANAADAGRGGGRA